MIARGIVRPVHELVATARRIAAGDYATLPTPTRNDEIGDLASAVRTMGEDIASRETRILDLAYRDPLTDLPNRALFAERLESALATAPAVGSVAVLLMDLDHFKYVNDTLGHEIGDLLLREVGTRLREAVKRPGCTVARLGGDEFAILLPGEWAAGAQRIAAALLRALEAPMTLDGHVVDVRASVGIAACPEHGHESSTLMRQADIAMYAAKRNNRGIIVWDERYNQHGHERLSLMSDLRKAVDRNELSLVYQPKVSLTGGAGPLRRGARALEPSDARRGAARRIHSVRGTDRLHPDDHAVGAGARHRAVRSVARRGLADQRVDQPVRARRDGRHAARSRRRAVAGARLRGAMDRAGDHRKRDPRRPRPRGGKPEAAERARLQACRSTTTAPAIRRWRICAGCRWTSSRSTNRS